MEIPAILVEKDVPETTPWGGTPPPGIEAQEFDILAFELWHDGSRPELADRGWPEEDEAVACHASCL